jgi:hypothetical protein
VPVVVLLSPPVKPPVVLLSPGGELRGIGVRFPTDGGAVRVPGPAESSHAGLGLACLRRRCVGPEVSPRRRECGRGSS